MLSMALFCGGKLSFRAECDIIKIGDIIMEDKIILKRKIYEQLVTWKNTSGRKSAVMIEGARRVGKSTLVENFAKKEFASYILVDFNKAPLEIVKLFTESRDDLDGLLSKLSLFYRVKLVPGESAIIFDEVQLCPEARSLIKYLVADGRYYYLETGSLISLKKNVQDIVIPSEELKLEMGPLDFEEFCLAMGDMVTADAIYEHYRTLKPFGDDMHRMLLKRFRTYLMVGGMPQAVIAYLNGEDFEAADRAKRGILELYTDDTHKFGDGNDAKVLAILEAIPGQLDKKNKRFFLSHLSENARGRSYEDAFAWLKESKIANLCFNVTDPSVGLKLTEDMTNVKCYLLDTGLLCTQAFLSKSYLNNEIYHALLFDKLNVNEGMIVENYVAQALRARGYELFFYAANDDVTRMNDMEVDFIIVQDKKLNPIEVKSGGYNRHSSLDKFKEKFGKKVGVRYVLHTRDLKVEGDVVYLPVYMAMCL